MLSQGEATKVSTLSKDQLQKFRTLGVKNGNQQFQAPTTSSKKIDKKTSQKKLSKKSKSLSPNDKNAVNLSELSAGAEKISSLSTSSVDQRPKDRSLKETKTNRQINENKKFLRQLGTSSEDAEKLKYTDFNLSFEPPEGVAEDELNSLEKIFYGFQKRTFQTYVSSFVTTFNDISRLRPKLKKIISSESHHQVARVTFDKLGHLISIKIIKSSESDEVYDLFSKTLQKMKKIPNPPTGLLHENGNFIIYYHLKIN